MEESGGDDSGEEEGGTASGRWSGPEAQESGGAGEGVARGRLSASCFKEKRGEKSKAFGMTSGFFERKTKAEAAPNRP